MTEVRRGIKGIRIGGSILDAWFDMKIYVRFGSSRSSPTVCTCTPANRTPVHAPHIATRYRKFTFPLMKVHGKHTSPARGNITDQNVSITTVRITDAPL